MVGITDCHLRENARFGNRIQIQIQRPSALKKGGVAFVSRILEVCPLTCIYRQDASEETRKSCLRRRNRKQHMAVPRSLVALERD